MYRIVTSYELSRDLYDRNKAISTAVPAQKSANNVSYFKALDDGIVTFNAAIVAINPPLAALFAGTQVVVTMQLYEGETFQSLISKNPGLFLNKLQGNSLLKTDFVDITYYVIITSLCYQDEVPTDQIIPTITTLTAVFLYL